MKVELRKQHEHGGKKAHFNKIPLISCRNTSRKDGEATKAVTGGVSGTCLGAVPSETCGEGAKASLQPNVANPRASPEPLEGPGTGQTSPPGAPSSGPEFLPGDLCWMGRFRCDVTVVATGDGSNDDM